MGCHGGVVDSNLLQRGAAFYSMSQDVEKFVSSTSDYFLLQLLFIYLFVCLFICSFVYEFDSPTVNPSNPL